MEIDLDDLEAKCRAATPGMWFSDGRRVLKQFLGSRSGRIHNETIADLKRAWMTPEEVKGNAEYMAYANPAVTLELIAQLRAAREFLPILNGLVADIQGLMSESHGVAGLHLNGDIAPWGDLEPGGRFERLSSLSAAIEAIGKAEA